MPSLSTEGHAERQHRAICQLTHRPHALIRRIEWKHCELLCFACSPACSPVPDSANEVMEVARDCQWGDTVGICWGGDLALIQRKLRERAVTLRRLNPGARKDLATLRRLNPGARKDLRRGG